MAANPCSPRSRAAPRARRVRAGARGPGGGGPRAGGREAAAVGGARAVGGSARAPGYRESSESWGGVLRDLRSRGLQAPLLAMGDGALGLWAALDEVFPTTEHQRCWNHRALNVQAKLPKRLQPEARHRLHEMAYAETQATCEELRDRYVADLRAADQHSAAETVLRDWE